MQKIIVYGLGANFYRYKENFFSEYDVVALTDSNLQVREKYSTDYNIIKPQEAVNLINESDDIKILIPVAKSRLIKEIYQYLSESITDSSKIIYPEKIDSLEGLAEFKQNAVFETVLNDYYFDVDVLEQLTDTNFDADPFSEIYRENVLRVHRALTGIEYSTDNEGYDNDNIDVESTVKHIIENIDALLRTGHHKDLKDIIKEVNIKPNDTIIDIGFGFGFSLMNFAKVSKNVYGIDISPKFHQIITQLLKELDISATLIKDDFYGISKIDKKFDVIYFHAAFHHCNDPVKLMNILSSKLADNGRIIFANEQIASDAKYPWNICVENADGLYQVCKQGWFEILFREDFFLDMVERSGLKLDRSFVTNVGHKNYIVVKK